MENASRAFLDAVGKSMRQIRMALGVVARIDPNLLTYAEKLQYEGFQRREETNASILSLSEDGVAIKEIVRRTGYSRGLIRKILRGQRSDIFRARPSSLDPYLPWLDAQWTAGCRNGLALWRALRQLGFRGCRGVVSEWSARRKRAEKADAGAIGRAPSARTIARLLTSGRDHPLYGSATEMARLLSRSRLAVQPSRGLTVQRDTHDEKREGGCNCGRVRFQTVGDPVRVGLCHCEICRKASGSHGNLFAVWSSEKVVVAGETHEWRHSTDSRHFCPTCGSPVFSIADETEVEIRVGAFDNPPAGLTPSYELWVARRETWQHPVQDAIQFSGNRT